MSMSSIHVFDGGVIPDSESSGGSSGSANIKNLIMRDFDLTIEGETVSSKILCDYDSPQSSTPYYTPVSIEDMAQWTKDGFDMQIRLESQPSIAANLGFLARVSISHGAIEDEVNNVKVFTYEKLDDHRIKFNILNFEKVTDEVTAINYLKLSDMDGFTLDSNVNASVDDILIKIPSSASSSNKLVTEQQLEDATASMASGYTPKGPASVSALNSLTNQENGDQYIVTDSGTLTDGSLEVTAGESVAWDSTNETWYKVNQYALKSVQDELSRQLENAPIAEDVGGYYDFAIVDNKNNILAMFKDGGLIVKNGEASTSNKTDTECDLAITDSQNNILAMFKDGGLIVKNGGLSTAAKTDTECDFAIVDNQNNILAMFKDGGIIVKNGGVSTVAKTGTDCDFAITDSQNNILAMFKNGGFTVKNGEVSTATKTGTEGDLVITDSQHNILAIFKGGGIKTAKFDSDSIINLDEKSFVDFRSEASAREFFDIINGSFDGNGMTLPAGWANAILSKKHFSFQDETLTFVVDVSDSDTIIYFGSRETLKIKTGSYGSCFKVDFSSHTMGLLANNMFDNDPSSVSYKFSNSSVDFSTWTKVILTLKRSERIITARLTNYYTSEYVEVTSNNTTSVGNYDGELYDSIFLASTEDLTIENFSFDIPMHPDVLFVGDSVSDGRGVLLGDSWPRKFGEYLGCRCCYAPRAGGRASTCVAFLRDWLGFVKPKVVVCSIGVNGGNTTEDFDEIVSLCKQANALLVLNTIYNAAASFTNINASEWNAYNAYILGINCLHIRFDIASSANKETPVFNALDSDYTMVDNVHPAAGGHQMLYDRAVVDAGQIKNLFL